MALGSYFLLQAFRFQLTLLGILQMIVSKPAIICHASQAFFLFLAMCCFASVASFQAKYHIGPCMYSLLVCYSLTQ